jgi:DNA-binding CsgD family transcriptional regulator
MGSMQGVFLAYNIVSLVAGGAATAAVLILYLKTKSPKIPALLATNLLLALLVAAFSYELFCDILGAWTPARVVVHEAEQFICLGLCAAAPRMYRPLMLGRFARLVEGGFALVSGLLAVAFGAILLLPRNETVYLMSYQAVSGLLTLATLYFILGSLVSRGGATPASSVRHYGAALAVLNAVVIVLFPAIFIVDLVGWMVPFIASRIPKGFNAIPLFFIAMSLTMLVGAIKDILEPEPPFQLRGFDEGIVRKCRLSKREAEILPLVLQFLSYKQIGERLFISVGTVKTHVIHIYQKTETRNRLDLARAAQGAAKDEEGAFTQVIDGGHLVRKPF